MFGGGVAVAAPRRAAVSVYYIFNIVVLCMNVVHNGRP